MGIVNTDSHNLTTFGQYLAAVFVVPILIIGVKRVRERAQELAASYRVRKALLPKKGNRHRQRGSVVEELRNLDDDTFQRMFRMPKHTFFDLESRVGPLLRAKKHWTVQSERMARISSGSSVGTVILLTATIRCSVCAPNTMQLNIHVAGGLQEALSGTLLSC